MNYLNQLEVEKNIKENCDLESCFKLCLENNKDEYFIKNSFKIKNRIYSDYDDKLFYKYQLKCFNECSSLKK